MRSIGQLGLEGVPVGIPAEAQLPRGDPRQVVFVGQRRPGGQRHLVVIPDPVPGAFPVGKFQVQDPRVVPSFTLLIDHNFGRAALCSGLQQAGTPPATDRPRRGVIIGAYLITVKIPSNRLSRNMA